MYFISSNIKIKYNNYFIKPTLISQRPLITFKMIVHSLATVLKLLRKPWLKTAAPNSYLRVQVHVVMYLKLILRVPRICSDYFTTRTVPNCFVSSHQTLTRFSSICDGKPLELRTYFVFILFRKNLLKIHTLERKAPLDEIRHPKCFASECERGE